MCCARPGLGAAGVACASTACVAGGAEHSVFLACPSALLHWACLTLTLEAAEPIEVNVDFDGSQCIACLAAIVAMPGCLAVPVYGAVDAASKLRKTSSVANSLVEGWPAFTLPLVLA